MIPGCCQRKHNKRGYDICVNDEETPKVIHDQDDLSEEDFTLRTVESLEVDAMLSKLSPIKGAKTPSNSKNATKVVTSTPRKKKPVTKVKSFLGEFFGSFFISNVYSDFRIMKKKT